MNDKNIFVALDVSGSMTEFADKMQEFLKLLCSQYKGKWPITVIEFTDDIQNVYSLTSYKDFNPEKGYCIGGTYFASVIEFMNKTRVPEKFKDFRICGPSKDDVLYIFTDGCGEHVLPKPEFGELYWVIPDKYLNNALFMRPIYGTVLTERLDTFAPQTEEGVEEEVSSTIKVLEDLENELIDRASEFTPTDYKVFYQMIQKFKKG